MRQAPRLILVSAGESVKRVLLCGDPISVLGSRRLASDHGARDGQVVGVDEEGDRLPGKIFLWCHNECLKKLREFRILVA